MFNDWHLAVTAYNAGEGKIQRGLAATGAKTFFELRRKNEQITVSGIACPMRTSSISPSFWLSAK